MIDQCLLEGECQQLERSQLGPDMAALVQQAEVYAAAHRNRPTVFDSTGWALQDLVIAELVLGHAYRLGLGVEVDLQPQPVDPYDPYEFVRG